MVKWKPFVQKLHLLHAKAITEPQCFNFSPKNSTSKLTVLANSHTKTWLHCQFPGGSSGDTKWPQLWRLCHVAAIWSPSSTRVPSSGDTAATDGSHIGGPLLLHRRNNRLKIFLFIFLRESKRGEEAWIEKKTLHFVFHIQGLASLFKRTTQMWF